MHTLTESRLLPRADAAMVAVVAVAAIVVAAHPDRRGAVMALGLAVAVVAAANDLAERRLPDALVAAVAVSAVSGAGLTGQFGVVVAGVALAGVPVLVVHLVSPTAMGFGDVKFAGALGGVVALVGAPWALVALCLASGLAALFGLLVRRASLPLGPALVVGAVAATIAASAAPDLFSQGRWP